MQRFNTQFKSQPATGKSLNEKNEDDCFTNKFLNELEVRKILKPRKYTFLKKERFVDRQKMGFNTISS